MEVTGCFVSKATIFSRLLFCQPHIHLVINCASMTSPSLRRKAFTANELNKKQTRQAVRFINDPNCNHLKPEEAPLSKTFSWFEGDFTKNGSLMEYLKHYAGPYLKAEIRMGCMEYDLKLNQQKTKAGEGL
jgi:hypothetical protein